MQETLIQIKNCSEEMMFARMGFFNIKTSDAEFIEEVQKYSCPFRLIMFLDENNGKHTEVYDEDDTFNPSIKMDLSERSYGIYKDESIPMECRMIVEKYIEFTADKFDKYGNTLEK